MTTISLNDKLKKDLLSHIKKTKKTDLIVTYLFFIEKKFNISPVLFPKEKTIYKNLENLVDHLEREGKLWRKTEIKIQFGQKSVNEETRKIYICPFTGKVFGDNTHPNPQDAIYDWVSNCPENKERSGGLPVKRFFVSEDFDIIKKYIEPQKESITKTVFSSAISGKLFNTKQAVIEDFKKNYIKPLSLFEVQNQNKFTIEKNFLEFIQEQLTEEKISSFVEALSQYKEFEPYVKRWLE